MCCVHAKRKALACLRRGAKTASERYTVPYGNEWLNCCHPALLAALRGVNVDVQLPYRLPFGCDQCGKAMSKQQQREIIRAVQRAQDAQTGYCADYCAKNQPMAFHEIKEFQKGHQHLHSKQQQEPIDKLAKRHLTRFLSDAYCKGIVRGQVECCNLRAHSKAGNVVAAERITTAAFCSFPGRNFLQTVNTAFAEAEEWTAGKKYVWTGKGSAEQRQLHEMDPAQVYGHRPKQDDVWFLSPYEFTMYWECLPLKMPQTRMEWMQQPRGKWDVQLNAHRGGKTHRGEIGRCQRSLGAGRRRPAQRNPQCNKQNLLRQQRWPRIAARLVSQPTLATVVPTVCDGAGAE